MSYDFDTLIERNHEGEAKWHALCATGLCDPDIVPCSVADMEFRVAPAIEAALQKQAALGIYGYSFPTSAYRQAVCSWLERRHNWKTEPVWQVQTYGVVPAIITAINTFTDIGDGVIIQTPVYHPFHSTVLDNGRRLVINPLKIDNGRYVMDFDDLREKARDPQTKLLLLCSPHNPVGRVWSRVELAELGRICCENGVLVFSDEIHFDIVFKPNQHTVFATLNDQCQQNCLIGTAASKTFNLAGLATSNIIIANPDLREKFVRTMQRSSGHFLNTFGMAATQAAYESGEDWLAELLAYLAENKRVCCEFIQNNLPMLKIFELEGTYLLWLDCQALGLDKKQLERFMIDEIGRASCRERV